MEEEMISSTITKSRGSDSSGSSSPIPNKTKRTSKYKGIVPQPNGNWGAQIYAKQKRIWLGTFKTEDLAAFGYDSAAVMLRHGNAADTQRNFPVNALTIHEPAFQALHTEEQVLNMIKDNSYHTKFCDYVSNMQVSNSSSVNSNQSNKKGRTLKELFRKGLTPSDVGKLNRIVIPKRYAIKYFSRKEVEAQGVDGVRYGDNGDIEFTFLDESSMRYWKFRYCFWQSSSSYVFTKGWNNFVKVKNLDANDTVVFNICELRGNSKGNENESKAVKKFFTIDVIRFNASEEPKEGNSSRKRSIDEDVSDDDGSDDDVELVTKKGKTEETVDENEYKGKVEETEGENENKGFKLFGVQISPPRE